MAASHLRHPTWLPHARPQAYEQQKEKERVQAEVQEALADLDRFDEMHTSDE